MDNDAQSDLSRLRMDLCRIFGETGGCWMGLYDALEDLRDMSLEICMRSPRELRRA